MPRLEPTSVELHRLAAGPLKDALPTELHDRGIMSIIIMSIIIMSIIIIGFKEGPKLLLALMRRLSCFNEFYYPSDDRDMNLLIELIKCSVNKEA